MKTKVLFLCALSMFMLHAKAGSGVSTVTDYDANVYNTVTIGTQVWLAENLKSLHYADGTAITGVAAYNDDNNNVATYGRLYNWNAAMKNTTIEMSQGVCPTGWHMPSDDEWTVLITHLGGINVAGGHLKESGTAHWLTPNTSADNSSGFTALPGGFWMAGAGYNLLTERAKFWTSSQNGATSAWECTIRYNQASTNGGSSGYTSNEKTLMASVRCIQGSGAVGVNNPTQVAQVKIFPNPTTDILTISLVEKGIVNVLDLSGKKLVTADLELGLNSISISNLSQGVYIVEVLLENAVTQTKIVKK